MCRILVIRHGNTFDEHQTPLRVGCNTDLSLSESGVKQSKAIGMYFLNWGIEPKKVIVSNLKRTQETAMNALQTAKLNIPITIDKRLNELDFGPDDGKPEEEVKARLGRELKDWEDNGTIPSDWPINKESIIANWEELLSELKHNFETDDMIVIITSSGVARFLGYLVEPPGFCPKMRTGAISSVHNKRGDWRIEFWDRRPNSL